MRNLERIREVEPQEMACILEECKAFGLKMIRYGENAKYLTKQHAMRSSEYTSMSGCFLISEKLATLEVTTMYHVNEKEKSMKPTTWVCSLNEQKLNVINGQKAYMQFQKAAHIPTLKQLGLEEIIHKCSIDGKFSCSAVPVIGSKTQNKAVFSNVYEFDINSAYASVLLRGVPNFAQIEYNRVVGHGEIGFMLDEALCLCKEGEIAEIVMPLMPCPVELKNYIYKWYALKKTGSQEAKAMLNYPIGYFQRTNPLFRAYVVNSCNNRIRELINENTITWNTDAVYTTEDLDLEIGEEIGQWKKRFIKKFTLLGCNYQIDDENPIFRGIPKYWFESFKRIHGRTFNLEIDTLPERVNKWQINWNSLTLEELK